MLNTLKNLRLVSWLFRKKNNLLLCVVQKSYKCVKNKEKNEIRDRLLRIHTINHFVFLGIRPFIWGSIKNILKINSNNCFKYIKILEIVLYGNVCRFVLCDQPNISI